MEQEEQEEPETFLAILQQEWPKPFALFTVEALWEHWGEKKKKNTSKKWCCNSRVWVVLPHVRGLVTVLFLSVQQP